MTTKTKNPQLKTKEISSKGMPTEGAIKHFSSVGTDRYTGRIRPDALEDMIETKVKIINAPYPGGAEAFPYQPQFHTVDRFYPMAKGGPVYIDEPKYDDDKKICAKKAEVMKKHGKRYVILTDEIDQQKFAELLGF